MGLNIDEILASLESEKTAEDIFAANLVTEPIEKVAQEEDTTESVVDAAVEDIEDAVEDVTEEKEAGFKPDAETVVAPEVTDEDLQKVAETLDAQGRLIARGFFDELVKLSEVTEEVDTEKVAELTKYAEAADNLMAAEYGEDYNADDVEKLASLMYEHDMNLEDTETTEKVAETEDEGTQILVNLYNRYHGGNN